MSRERLIRASEIGEYVYCRRSWWLHMVVGVTPEGRQRREQGVAQHARHGRRVRASQLLALSGLALLLLAGLVLLLGS